MKREAWWAAVHGVTKESDMTEVAEHARMRGVTAKSDAHFGQRRWHCISFFSKGFTFIGRVLTGFVVFFPLFLHFFPSA